jgi:hypothetical protein
VIGHPSLRSTAAGFGLGIVCVFIPFVAFAVMVLALVGLLISLCIAVCQIAEPLLASDRAAARETRIEALR